MFSIHYYIITKKILLFRFFGTSHVSNYIGHYFPLDEKGIEEVLEMGL